MEIIFIYQLCSRILFLASLANRSLLLRSVNWHSFDSFLVSLLFELKTTSSGYLFTSSFSLFFFNHSAILIQSWMLSHLWIHWKFQAWFKMIRLAYVQIVWRKWNPSMSMTFGHLIWSNPWSKWVLRRQRDSTCNTFMRHLWRHYGIQRVLDHRSVPKIISMAIENYWSKFRVTLTRASRGASLPNHALIECHVRLVINCNRYIAFPV